MLPPRVLTRVRARAAQTSWLTLPTLGLPLLFKANAAFLTVFALQFIFMPQFLFDTNFDPAPTLDEFHLFFCRGFGVLALGMCWLITKIDSKKFLPYITLYMICFCTAAPFYAQAKMSVKLPEHYFPIGGCCLLIAAHLYAYVTKVLKPKLDAATLTKFTAAFYGFFSAQFLFCPQFLYDTNFSEAKTLDEFHLFICQAFGVLGLFFCGLIIQLPAKKYLTFMTVFNVLFSSSLPFYAQYAFAVKLPDHYLPVGGCALICLAHVALWYKSK